MRPSHRFLQYAVVLLAPLLAPPAQAATNIDALKPKIEALAESKQWLRLLHFKRTVPLRRLRSRVVPDAPFFLDPKGYKNPEAEMIADIKAFEAGGIIGSLKQHPQCAFPE